MLGFTCTICIAQLPHLISSLHFFASTYEASALHELTADRAPLMAFLMI